MISLLNSEERSRSTPAKAETPAEPREPAPVEEPVEFEFVLGRRQMASASLMILVLLAVFSGLSYVVGKSGALEKSGILEKAGVVKTAESAPVQAAPATIPATPPAAAAVTTPASIPAPTATAKAAPEAAAAPPKPLYGDPRPGSVYIQVGAVEKGIAAIMTEGLRTHGLDAFVAPGPSEHIYRVLIGPLPKPEDYMKAQLIVDQIGLTTFARRYEASR